MVVLELVNNILALIGEQPLASSSGTLGSMVKTITQTAINSLAQSVRPQAFEQVITMSTTNSSFEVPVGSIPENTIQIYNVYWRQGDNTPFQFRKMDSQPFELLANLYGYAIIGNNLYVSNLINRDSLNPLSLSLHCLVAPTLPTADDAEVVIPTLLLPAIQHMAASILLVSYVDDANAAAQHQRLAETMTNMLRLQLGVSRGRQFSIGMGYNHGF